MMMSSWPRTSSSGAIVPDIHWSIDDAPAVDVAPPGQEPRGALAMNLAAVDPRQVGLDGLGHEGGHWRPRPPQLVIVVGRLVGLVGSRGAGRSASSSSHRTTRDTPACGGSGSGPACRGCRSRRRPCGTPRPPPTSRGASASGADAGAIRDEAGRASGRRAVEGGACRPGSPGRPGPPSWVKVAWWFPLGNLNELSRASSASRCPTAAQRGDFHCAGPGRGLIAVRASGPRSGPCTPVRTPGPPGPGPGPD